MKATGAGCPEVYGALLPGEIENWTNPASQIRNPKYGIGLTRAGPIGDFGFEIQDSSNFKILLYARGR